MTIILLILSLILLFIGGELFVKGSAGFATKFGISPTIIGLTIVAFGTSAPELVVSIKASLAGNDGISIGNVVGSNIFNLLFILGLCSLVAPLKVRYIFIKFDVPVMIFSSILFGIMALDEKVSFIEGIVLISFAIIYLFILIKTNKSIAPPENPTDIPYLKLAIYTLAGFSLLIYGSGLLVENAITISKTFNISDKVIGLTIVAAGTSLPELITSVVATYRGEREIAVGNVIGSCILNIFIILGISSQFSHNGLTVAPSLLYFDIPLMILISLLAWPLMRTDYKLDRKEGTLLFVFYLSYTFYLVKFH